MQNESSASPTEVGLYINHTQDKEWKDMVTQQTQSSFPLGDLVSQENWSKINLVG